MFLLFFLGERKKVFPANKLGRNRIFVINQCEIRLSDKTHSETCERLIRFLIKNQVMNFINGIIIFIPRNKTSRNF